MPTITFIHQGGRAESVNADDGDSAMSAAMRHGIDGIIGECGGTMVCATCHVYVDELWLDKLGPVSSDEDDLLEGVADERLPSSRLSCQIKIVDALDGLVVRLPQRQL